MNAKLPFSMEPEYQAAQRAYMRYHNMDPIFGISSKYVYGIYVIACLLLRYLPLYRCPNTRGGRCCFVCSYVMRLCV